MSWKRAAPEMTCSGITALRNMSTCSMMGGHTRRHRRGTGEAGGCERVREVAGGGGAADDGAHNSTAGLGAAGSGQRSREARHAVGSWRLEAGQDPAQAAAATHRQQVIIWVQRYEVQRAARPDGLPASGCVVELQAVQPHAAPQGCRRLALDVHEGGGTHRGQAAGLLLLQPGGRRRAGLRRCTRLPSVAEAACCRCRGLAFLLWPWAPQAQRRLLLLAEARRHSARLHRQRWRKQDAPRLLA